MPAKTEKTNAMRALDARKITYVTHAYPAERHSAEEVAELLGFPANQVFKTLVVLPEKGRPLLAIVPGDAELDLKKLAQVSEDKRLRMATQREAESLTGLLVGGISALALLNKGFRVFLDASSDGFETVLVSGGQRGINLQLRPQDLAAITGARQADLTRPPAE
ncbi:MAG: aminoacyl-tRNA deacylase [Anaerolineae bacterium]